MALHIGGNEADAEEVLVDSFFQVWKQAGRYNASRGTVAGWILNIVRSRAIDSARSRLRVVRSLQKMKDGEEEAPMASPPPNPEKQAMARERQSVVREAMQTLPEDQRVVMELGYFSGLSQSEIATELGQPLGTVKTRMRLAMQKLRRVLVQEQEDHA
jgi:RNA polymerase sigma-70 factor (ECF subfamily)